jgi:hypothetical protein
MGIHVVKRGDTLSAIAKQYGVKSWQEIYNHSSNALFRRKRPNPNRIYPGDRINIPATGAPRRIPNYTVIGMGPKQLIKQTKTMGCWYASARMLVQWRRQRNLATDGLVRDPSEDSISAAKRAADTGISDAEIVGLAKRLGLKLIPPMSPTPEAIERWLQDYGPLWTNGSTHITVIAGIRNDKLYVFDPAKNKPEWRPLSWYIGSKHDSRDTSTTSGIFMHLPR